MKLIRNSNFRVQVFFQQLYCITIVLHLYLEIRLLDLSVGHYCWRRGHYHTLTHSFQIPRYQDTGYQGLDNIELGSSFTLITIQVSKSVFGWMILHQVANSISSHSDYSNVALVIADVLSAKLQSHIILSIMRWIIFCSGCYLLLYSGVGTCSPSAQKPWRRQF